MVINTQNLNPLEQEIYDKLLEYCKTKKTLRILDAASLCGCSTSKISKFVKKMGFDNFKQFTAFANGETPETVPSSTEFDRIRYFLDEFDPTCIQVFLNLLSTKSKVILLGLGPSSYCAQYMEYKLRLLYPDKLIIAEPDTIAAEALLDDKTLLVIFSTTGRFRSFGETCQKVRDLGGSTLLVIEEYNPELVRNYEQDHLIFLSSQTQSSSLVAHQKSRVLTFIFIEEVLFHIMKEKGIVSF